MQEWPGVGARDQARRLPHDSPAHGRPRAALHSPRLQLGGPLSAHRRGAALASRPLDRDRRRGEGRACEAGLWRARGGKADDDAHRPGGVGLCPCDARYRRERGSARGQMQESTAGKFHDDSPSPSSVYLRTRGFNAGDGCTGKEMHRWSSEALPDGPSSPRPGPKIAELSAARRQVLNALGGVHTRVLTAPRPIKPTSPRCHSAWQPNPDSGPSRNRPHGRH
jgi:hypothetical protein